MPVLRLTPEEKRVLQRAIDIANDLDESRFTDFNSAPVKASLAIDALLRAYE